MTKQSQYAALVEKRKKDPFFPALLNPSQIENGRFDCPEIGAWSRWHNDLDAEIMLIGQDWGNKDYFTTNEGRDTDSNPTNKNLTALFRELGYELGSARPEKPFQKGLFFTNAILGIKEGDMSAPVSSKWVKHCNEHYTKSLIEIIQPKVIICLGMKAYEAMRLIYSDLPIKPMAKLAEDSFPVEGGKIQIFPRFHCGGLGIRNRSFDKQQADWQKINAVLKH